jgi:hypothetical protein
MGVEELGRQVAVAGDNLDPVESRPLESNRRLRVALDDFLDLGDVQGARHDVESLVRHRRRSQRHRTGSVLGLHYFATGMKQLSEDLGAALVQRGRQFGVASDA